MKFIGILNFLFRNFGHAWSTTVKEVPEKHKAKASWTFP